MLYTRNSVADVNKWVGDVRRQRAAFESQGAAGLPAEWRPRGSKMPKIYEPLARAINGTEWVAPLLEAVGGAMAMCKGAGKQVGLTAQRLKDYRARI